MKEWMKQFRNWMMETGTLLSEPQPKTAEAEIRGVEGETGVVVGRSTPIYEIEPSGRKNGGLGAFASVRDPLKSVATPIIREFRVDLDEALRRPDVVVVNGSRYLPEVEADPMRRSTISDVNAIRIALSQRITFEQHRGRAINTDTMRRASDMLGYLSRELVAQDRRLFEAQHGVEYRERDVLKLRTERDSLTGQLADMTTNRDALEGIVERKQRALDKARAERDSFEAALNAQAETSAKLSTMYGAGHADTEAEAVERDAFLNCPACKGSGHIADVEKFDITKPRTPRQDALLSIEVLERFANGLGPITTADARRIAARFRDYLDVVDALKADRDAALAQVTALSQPRIVNVAGLVDADLAERYESLWQSFDLVNSELKRLKEATPTYGETERNAAINAVAKHGARIESSGLWANVEEIVDLTARTLGMRRAGA